MQPGPLVSGDVQAFTSRIVVAGVSRPHQSWSVSRELQGDLPEQVVAGSGIRQATGRIVWAQSEDVTTRISTPWNAAGRWLPKNGDLVTIYASDGVTEWPQFVGVIDDTTADAGGPMESSIVDYVDYLNRPITHAAVLRKHPPRTEGGQFMSVGMSAGYAVDRALRASGFYATPKPEGGYVWSVPAQMSMWPERGSVTAAGDFLGGWNEHAANWRAAWGWCVGNFNCTYSPQGTIARTEPVQLSMRVGLNHAGTVYIACMYGSMELRLSVSPTRVAAARLDGVLICSLQIEPAFTIIELLVKDGVWTLKTNGGAFSTGTQALPAGDSLSSISLVGNTETRAAGFQVSKPSSGSEFQALGHTDSYYSETSEFAAIMDAMPGFVNRRAIDLLTEISKSNLSAMWFTETGLFKFIGSDVLRGQAVVQTVTTLDDVQSLSWSDSRLGVRSSVGVKYEASAIDRSRYSNVQLWTGSGDTMESDQEKNLFAEAPSDEEWVTIDDLTVVNDEGLTALNQGRGSWMSGYLEDSAGAWTPAYGYYNSSLSIVNHRTRLFSITTLALPAGKKFVLAVPDDAASYFPRFRGSAYPVLRGRGKVKWIDATVTAALAGPVGAAALEHDAGRWVSSTVAGRLADFIAGQVTTPSPTITGMRVTYDPRRQLGDVIIISSPALLGVSIRALIVGVWTSAGGSYQQSLDLRIISATTTYVTYGDFEFAHKDSLTYEQWRLLFPDTATYATFDSNPLNGA